MFVCDGSAALLCYRLVKSCRELWILYLHCTADTGRAVLTALKEADLGRDSYGEPRTIDLRVPGR